MVLLLGWRLYLVMGLVWPWAVLDPLNPIRSLEYFSVFFEKPWKEMFGGQLIPVPEMPRSYVPTLFALKLPEIFLALAAAGIVWAMMAATRNDIALRKRAALVLLVVAATLPIIIAMVTKPAAYNGIRHFIFVTPALAALGGYAGARLIDWLGRRGQSARAAGAAVLIVGFAAPVIEQIRLHPYQYTYFNHIAGGVAGADDRYMLDYWGLSFKEAGEALRARLEQEPVRRSRRWTVAVCGPHPPARIALGEDFVLTWDPQGADFALVLGEFYCAQLDAPVLVEIAREGVVYARAYDIRAAGYRPCSRFRRYSSHHRLCAKSQ